MNKYSKTTVVFGAFIIVGLVGIGGYFLYDFMDNQRSPPPHIIMVLVDDMGFNDIGYNNPEVITPNLDKLAKDGLILDNNYALPMCSPSRAALLTGIYPFKLGMQYGPITPKMAHCLPTNVPILSDMLQGSGYQTHLLGKWHLGHCKNECLPANRGFDSFYGMYSGAGDFFTHTINGGYDWRNGTQVDKSVVGEYTTHIIRDRALSIIGNYEDGSKPLFIMLSYSAPHTPFQVPDKYKELYPNIKETRKTFLAMITAVDEAMGKVINKLKDKDIWKNTFLMFSSDNGGQHRTPASNYPLRGGKVSLFEGGTRVPGFASGPLIKKKGIATGLYHFIDWVPTILNIVGSTFDTTKMDGIDQTELLLKGGNSKRTDMVYNIDIEWRDWIFMGNAAVRQGDWKLIWGVPGWIDGYTPNTTIYYHSNEYLSLINKTFDEYTDLSTTGIPRPVNISPQERENREAIAKIIGIYNFTQLGMPIGLGQTMLFNIKDDPEERFNLAEDKDQEERITKMKEFTISLIRDEYVSKLDNYMANNQGPGIIDGVWSTEFCLDTDTDIPGF